MTIQPLNTKIDSTTTLPAKNQKTISPDQQTVKTPTDSVEITATTKNIINAFESSDTSQLLNKERINAVKKELEAGTYPINAEQIADKLIQFELSQTLDSR